MYPHSERFALATQGRLGYARSIATVELLEDGAPVEGTQPKVTDWQVQYDGSQSVRGRASITLVDQGLLLPDDPEALVSPFGPEFKVYAGYEYQDGTRELLPLGVFGIYDVEDISTDHGKIKVEGSTRERLLQESKWEDFYTPTVAVDYSVAIRALIADRIPSARFDFATVGQDTPGNVVLGGERDGDPLADALRLAESVGHELFVDRDGTWVLQPIGDDDPTPVVRFTAGEHKPWSIGRRWSRADWYNKVVITGERAGQTIVQATATHASYGLPLKRTLVESSELAFNSGQAARMARGRLNQVSRRSEMVEITTLPHPGLEPGDRVEVVVGNTSVVQSIDTHQLSAGGSQINGKGTARRLVRALKAARSDTRWHWATVSGSPSAGLASVVLGGVTVSDVPHAAGLSLSSGDQVRVQIRGTEAFIDAAVA